MTQYSGSCQCGNIRFEADAEIKKVVACNCSRCVKVGALWSAVTPDKFKLLSGEGKTTNYQFHKNVIDHPFCKTCGVQAFATGKGPNGKQMVMMNVRCLDGVDATKFEVMTFDGASL